MLTFNQPVAADTKAQHIVELPYHQRVKGRLRIKTLEGQDAGIVIARGNELCDGDKLSDGNGQVLQIKACAEKVSVASSADALLFSRACYHIGNRHAQVQIEANELIYLTDSVLDDMLRQLGLLVEESERAFSPENGAYTRGHSHAGHSHSHDNHQHKHRHEHE